MAPPLHVTLDQAAREELDRRYQTTRDATTHTRYQMVLLRAEGHPVVQVAHITRRSPDTVRRPRGPQARPGRWARRCAAPVPPGPATPLPARLGGRAGPGRRGGSALGRGGQRAVELSAAGRLAGRR